jgi:hypothetical protein
VAAPSWLPAGSFGFRVGTYGDHPIVAERSMYNGTEFTVGHSGIGDRTGGRSGDSRKA